ncbi:MAG: hypothetical protein V4539_02465 [Bacteroidota bacterium]
MKIHCTGWEIGIKKISLTMYLKNTCGYSLTQAADIKTMILDEIPVDIYIPPNADIHKILKELQEIGVKCEIIESKV